MNSSSQVLSAAGALALAVTGVAMSQSRFDDAPSEPVFMALPRVDLELIAGEAQSTLDHFRILISGPDLLPIVKARFENAAGDAIHLWLSVESAQVDGFEAVSFEAPPEFPELASGAKRFIANDAIEDWAVSIDGVMHGGFSLRLQRSKLPEPDRQSYDNYVGAQRGWAPLPQGPASASATVETVVETELSAPAASEQE